MFRNFVTTLIGSTIVEVVVLHYLFIIVAVLFLFVDSTGTSIDSYSTKQRGKCAGYEYATIGIVANRGEEKGNCIHRRLHPRHRLCPLVPRSNNNNNNNHDGDDGDDRYFFGGIKSITFYRHPCVTTRLSSSL